MAAMTAGPRARRALQLAFGVAIVAGTLAVVGTGALLRGLAAVSPAAIAAAVLLAGLATAAAAWRWRTVSRQLGQPLPWPMALAAYYRSQFVNSVLPGGVIGDVHRAYRQGASGEPALAARAVATERLAGQLVQAVATVVVLAVPGLASPRGGWPPAGLWGAGAGALIVPAGLIVAALAAAAVAIATPRGRRRLTHEWFLVRTVFRTARSSISIVVTSLIVVAAHAGTFVVACHAVGITAPPLEVAALALVTLGAGSLPINVGGWGPREAAAATVFGVAGLGAGAGVAASTAFGVLAIVAVLPGAVVLIVDRARPLRLARSVAAVGDLTRHPLPEERAA